MSDAADVAISSGVLAAEIGGAKVKTRLIEDGAHPSRG
jgi:hypothetical protein